MSTVTIHYLRLPDRLTTFRQALVQQDPLCVVTLMERTPLPRPVTANGAVILEPDAPVVWFTFPDRWYDIGLFHLADGSVTGCYANVITPVRFRSPLAWDTTDLFLDVWSDPEGNHTLLDEDELEQALAAGWIGAELAAAARSEAAHILADAAAGSWPPAPVRAWTLERARAAAARHLA